MFPGFLEWTQFDSPNIQSCWESLILLSHSHTYTLPYIRGRGLIEIWPKEIHACMHVHPGWPQNEPNLNTLANSLEATALSSWPQVQVGTLQMHEKYEIHKSYLPHLLNSTYWVFTGCIKHGNVLKVNDVEHPIVAQLGVCIKAGKHQAGGWAMMGRFFFERQSAYFFRCVPHHWF